MTYFFFSSSTISFFKDFWEDQGLLFFFFKIFLGSHGFQHLKASIRMLIGSNN
jgi:hypothetical protein